MTGPPAAQAGPVGSTGPEVRAWAGTDTPTRVLPVAGAWPGLGSPPPGSLKSSLEKGAHQVPSQVLRPCGEGEVARSSPPSLGRLPGSTPWVGQGWEEQGSWGPWRVRPAATVTGHSPRAALGSRVLFLFQRLREAVEGPGSPRRRSRERWWPLCTAVIEGQGAGAAAV